MKKRSITYSISLGTSIYSKYSKNNRIFDLIFGGDELLADKKAGDIS
ncbi:hypothetical protein [Sporohalobacter salinus]|nr:hypothetical protein [Sporohalobacter salinus]MBM7625066.1 hypothetical protein [Sporohalobacter salinus]